MTLRKSGHISPATVRTLTAAKRDGFITETAQPQQIDQIVAQWRLFVEAAETAEAGALKVRLALLVEKQAANE